MKTTVVLLLLGCLIAQSSLLREKLRSRQMQQGQQEQDGQEVFRPMGSFAPSFPMFGMQPFEPQEQNSTQLLEVGQDSDAVDFDGVDFDAMPFMPPQQFYMPPFLPFGGQAPRR